MIDPNKTYSLQSLYYYQTMCNLNCRHCWLGPGLSYPGKKNDDVMSLDMFRDMLEQGVALGLKHIKFTGGEPFCDSGFLQKMEAARALSLSVSIETNATLITKALSREMKKLGVRFMALSLDGADPDSHNKQRGNKEAYTQTMAGLEILIEENIKPQVIFTPTKTVLSQTEAMIELLNRFPIDSLKVNIISLIGKGDALHKIGNVPSIREYLELNDRIESGRIRGKGYPIILDIPSAFKSMGRIMRKRQGRCGIQNILGVLSDGRISICGVGLVNDALVLGRLQTDRLEKIWKNHTVINTLHTGLPYQIRGICGDCVMKRMCLGKCRAEAFVAEGDLMAPSVFCAEADRLGLFPVTRQISKIKAG